MLVIGDEIIVNALSPAWTEGLKLIFIPIACLNVTGNVILIPALIYRLPHVFGNVMLAV